LQLIENEKEEENTAPGASTSAEDSENTVDQNNSGN